MKHLFLATTCIRQLILNLIDNAVKYSLDNGTITLLLVKDETFAHIIVMDNGIGIPADSQLKILIDFTELIKLVRAKLVEQGLDSRLQNGLPKATPENFC